MFIKEDRGILFHNDNYIDDVRITVTKNKGLGAG